ncbi:hypothetical protein EBU24_03445 [bacterium]|nr:hypothetical protein [bacterium]
MQTLNFGKGHMMTTIAGTKKITLRKYGVEPLDFKKNEIIYGEFKDGLTFLLKITADTEKKFFNDLTDKEAQEDGFINAKDAFNGLKIYYPDLQLSDILAIIRYEIATLNNAPIVNMNRFHQS